MSLSTRGLAEFFDSDDKWTWNKAKLNTGMYSGEVNGLESARRRGGHDLGQIGKEG